MTNLEKMLQMKTEAVLTEKESVLFSEIIKKYDDNCGFLIVKEIKSFSGKTRSGLISSLTNKDLIYTNENDGDIEIWVNDPESPWACIAY